MSKLLKHYWTEDYRGQSVLCVEKSRGKISLAELENYLLHEARIHSHWIIIINASEGACDVGWPLAEEQNDKVFLYEYSGEDTCPLCAYIMPPEYCPHCGKQIVTN